MSISTVPEQEPKDKDILPTVNGDIGTAFSIIRVLEAENLKFHVYKLTLGVAAEVVTSLLARQVINEPEHIVLALETNRGVKMSPQIAPGHQMSAFPLHSTPLFPSYSVLVSPFSNLPVFLIFLWASFHLLTSIRMHLSIILSLLLSSNTALLFIFSKGQGGREQRKESELS